MKKKDLMRSELIGLRVSVDSKGCCVNGIVVDETKNTVIVESAGTEKTIPKQGNQFLFEIGDQQIPIEGSEIRHRPEDRIKKVR